MAEKESRHVATSVVGVDVVAVLTSVGNLKIATDQCRQKCARMAGALSGLENRLLAASPAVDERLASFATLTAEMDAFGAEIHELYGKIEDAACQASPVVESSGWFVELIELV